MRKKKIEEEQSTTLAQRRASLAEAGLATHLLSRKTTPPPQPPLPTAPAITVSPAGVPVPGSARRNTATTLQERPPLPLNRSPSGSLLPIASPALSASSSSSLSPSLTSSSLAISLENSGGANESATVVVPRNEKTFSYADLRDNNVFDPSFNPMAKESYLSDEEFCKVLGVSVRAAFYELPPWKREKRRKETGLW